MSYEDNKFYFDVVELKVWAVTWWGFLYVKKRFMKLCCDKLLRKRFKKYSSNAIYRKPHLWFYDLFAFLLFLLSLCEVLLFWSADWKGLSFVVCYEIFLTSLTSTNLGRPSIITSLINLNIYLKHLTSTT
jgi:hypothetical protein